MPNDIGGVEIEVIGNRMQPIIFAISINNVSSGEKTTTPEFVSTAWYFYKTSLGFVLLT